MNESAQECIMQKSIDNPRNGTPRYDVSGISICKVVRYYTVECCNHDQKINYFRIKEDLRLLN